MIEKLNDKGEVECIVWHIGADSGALDTVSSIVYGKIPANWVELHEAEALETRRFYKVGGDIFYKDSQGNCNVLPGSFSRLRQMKAACDDYRKHRPNE